MDGTLGHGCAGCYGRVGLPQSPPPRQDLIWPGISRLQLPGVDLTGPAALSSYSDSWFSKVQGSLDPTVQSSAVQRSSGSHPQKLLVRLWDWYYAEALL